MPRSCRTGGADRPPATGCGRRGGHRRTSAAGDATLVTSAAPSAPGSPVSPIAPRRCRRSRRSRRCRRSRQPRRRRRGVGTRDGPGAVGTEHDLVGVERPDEVPVVRHRHHRAHTGVGERPSRSTTACHVARSCPEVGSSSTTTGRGGDHGADREPPLLTAGQREGLRRRGAGARERVEQLVHAGVHVGQPRARGPTASSSRTLRATNWCSGPWNTVPIRAASCRLVQSAGVGPASPARSAPARMIPVGRPEGAGERQPERRLADPLRPRDRETRPGRTSSRCPCATRASGRAAARRRRRPTRVVASPRADSSASARAGSAAARSGAGPSSSGRNPSTAPRLPCVFRPLRSGRTPAGRPAGRFPRRGPTRPRRERRTVHGEHARGGPFRDDASGGLQGARAGPPRRAMCRSGARPRQGRSGGVEERPDGVVHLPDAVRVEVRARLVEHEGSPGRHREHCRRAPDAAAARRRAGSWERSSGRSRPTTSRASRTAAPRSRPGAHPRSRSRTPRRRRCATSRVGLGVLHDEADAPADRAGVGSVDEDRACTAAACRRRVGFVREHAATARRSVDLPAPEGPTIATRSPGSTRRSTPRTAQASRPAYRQPQSWKRDTCGTRHGHDLHASTRGPRSSADRRWSRSAPVPPGGVLAAGGERGTAHRRGERADERPGADAAM